MKTLNLEDNELTALPESIVSLTNLTRLYLSGNPRLLRSTQSTAVQMWLQGLEDSLTWGLLF